MKKIRIVAFFTALLCFITAFNIPVFAVNESETDIEYILGDVDLNGKITAADARLALRCSAKLEKLSDVSMLAADYIGDGKITAADARAILKVAAGFSPDYVLPTAPVTTTEPATSAPATTQPVTETPVTSKIISVATICQYPNYPSGCESVAAVMNLNYYGINVTVDKFIDSYLPTGSAPNKNSSGVWYSSDPNEVFLGDPRSEKGWGIWATGLAKAINKCLDDYPGSYSVTVTYSETLDSLCEKYIVKNIPVLVWVTAYMKEPYQNITANIIGTKRTFTWISPNHCMLLVGFDENNYYFNDPITGKREKYSKSASNTAFKGNGSQAIIISK